MTTRNEQRLTRTHCRYWAIFWIDGSSKSSLQSGYAQIAQQLGLAGDSAATVLQCLATRLQLWLLVIDNADDPGLNLAPYLPRWGIGNVLITTRNAELSVFSTGPRLLLEGLAKVDARALLFTTAAISKSEQKSMNIAADDILQTLGFHTLAIIQAGAFIRESCDLTDYLPLLQKQRKKVLSYENGQARSQYGNVYATFEVSASKLQEAAEDTNNAQQQSAADAIHLLQLFAFMDTRGPFEWIFSEARESAAHFSQAASSTAAPYDAHQQYFRGLSSVKSRRPRQFRRDLPYAMCFADMNDFEVLSQQCSHLLSPVAHMANDVVGKSRWRRARARLYQLSMLSFEKDADGHEVLIFHPLILAWALDRQSAKDRETSWFSVAATIVLCSRGTRSHGPLLYRLGPHVRTCASHVSKRWWRDTRNAQYLSILYHLSCMLFLNHDDAINSKVCDCMELSLEANKKRASYCSKGRVEIDYLLGLQAGKAGNISKAIQLLEHVVKIAQETPVETHPYYLASQHALARAYHSNGQIEDAVQLLEHVVNKYQETLVETHPYYLASQYTLATVYYSNGQIEDAVQLLEHVVKMAKGTLAQTHPHYLASQYALAIAYLSNRQIEDAVQLLEYVVKKEQEALVETHPDYLASLSALAIAYLSNRQIEDAVQLLERVVKKEQEALVETHPHRIASQYALARAYHSNGQIEDAVQLLEHVVKMAQRTLAETHPFRLAVESSLRSMKASSRSG